MMKIFTYLLLILAALPVLAADAFEPDDWEHKQKIILDNTETGAGIKEAVSQFPVAVRLHSGNFTFTEAKPDGGDLRFLAADGKTPLKFHIEKFDAANELAVAWVQVPKLTPAAQSDSFVMAWGNPKAASSGDAKGTYDASQIFAFHFSDQDAIRDATANAIAVKESTAKPVFAGPMGGAVEFDGSGHIALAASPALQVTAANGFTFSAWLKPVGAEAGKLLTIGGPVGSGAQPGVQPLSIELVSGIPVVTLGTVQAKASAPLKPATWQHFAVVASGGKLTFYVDGVASGSSDFVLADVAGDAVLGEGYKGEMDEATLAGVGRSADYIKALTVSQSAEAAMVVFDEGEAKAESVNYMAILLGAVTIDGWVVIGILGVMAVISVWVMITKTGYLLASQKGNDDFSERFKKSSAALLMPGSSEARGLLNPEGVLKNSPVYRLYQTGAYEMNHRFETQQKAGIEHNLSGAALDAIRASVDATMVRETHRLNAQMVLLTIAISGGPFLGLLGTVVGVMITFAAIAAAGDVNVNSIAPGIAAALVATVAGLAVAIPALFGYNWLASKIKNITTDMHVFADEFVTKAAELHSK
jgi:biopolymer transport protein ExbB